MDAIEEFRYLVLAAQREGARALAAGLKQHGLTPAQAEAIAVLRDARRALSVKEIGERLVCEGGSPSRLMSTLKRKGLIEPSADPADARLTLHSLTTQGVEAARAVNQVEHDLYEMLAMAVDLTAIDSARSVLRGFVANTPTGLALQRRIADRPGLEPRPA